MNWYTLSCREDCGASCIEVLGASIIPLDSLRDEKVSLSEKLLYEVKDLIEPHWVLHPSFVHLSDAPVTDRSLLGKEVMLHACSMHKSNNLFIIRFETEDIDVSGMNMEMIVASKDISSIEREEISEWSEVKNFSLYSFLADVGNDFSVIL